MAIPITSPPTVPLRHVGGPHAFAANRPPGYTRHFLIRVAGDPCYRSAGRRSEVLPALLVLASSAEGDEQRLWDAAF